MKLEATDTSFDSEWCSCMKCINILISYGTNKLNEAKIMVMNPPDIICHLNVQIRFLNKELYAEVIDFLICLKRSNLGGEKV